MRNPMNSVIEPHRLVVRSNAACEGDAMIDDVFSPQASGSPRPA